MDTAAVYRGFTNVSLATYRYSEAWATLRGINTDLSVRGVIAQELKHIGPFNSRVEIADYEDDDFVLEKMFKVDKQGLVLDLIAAVQAKHKCYMPNRKDGSVSIQTSDAATSTAATINTGASIGAASGSAYVTTGSASHDSGHCIMSTGFANSVGTIALASAKGGGFGGTVQVIGGQGAYSTSTMVVAGSGALLGGNAQAGAGRGSNGGAVYCVAPKMGSTTIGYSDSGSTMFGGATALNAMARVTAVAGTRSRSGATFETREARPGSGDIHITSHCRTAQRRRRRDEGHDSRSPQ